jgi:hypothetical protein
VKNKSEKIYSCIFGGNINVHSSLGNVAGSVTMDHKPNEDTEELGLLDFNKINYKALKK